MPSDPPVPTDARLGGRGVVAVGDNVVDQYPDLGVMYPGGNAVNVAVHVQRIGARAAYVGVLGTDRAGVLVRRALETEGVDIRLIRTVEGENAHATVRVVDGNRVFVGGEIGVSRFRLSDADLLALEGFDVVHTGECSMTEDDLPRMREHARLLSFDFSERDWDYVAEHAPQVDIAVLSTPDADPGHAADLAQRVHALGPRVVAVTLGAAGAVLLDPAGVHHAPAGSGSVVDTLGAGDAFIARLLVGLAAGERGPTAAAAATAYATATCASYGAFGYEAPLLPEPTGSAPSAP